MYKCKPERNPKQAVLLLLCSILLIIGTFSLGILWEEYKGISRPSHKKYR